LHSQAFGNASSHRDWVRKSAQAHPKLGLHSSHSLNYSSKRVLQTERHTNHGTRQACEVSLERVTIRAESMACLPLVHNGVAIRTQAYTLDLDTQTITAWIRLTDWQRLNHEPCHVITFSHVPTDRLWAISLSAYKVEDCRTPSVRAIDRRWSDAVDKSGGCGRCGRRRCRCRGACTG